MKYLRSLGLIPLIVALASCGGGGGGSTGGSTIGGGTGGGGGSQTLLNATLQGTYYKVPTNGDADFVCDTTTASQTTGLVQAQLSANGLPVASTGAPIFDLSPSREVLWWSTSNPNVTVDVASVTTGIPISLQDFFPTGQTTDSLQMRTAHWKGTLPSASNSTFTFTVSSDDDSWVFLDGALALDNGGVKAVGTTVKSVPVTAGNHTVDIFYADRCTAKAVMGFAVTQP